MRDSRFQPRWTGIFDAEGYDKYGFDKYGFNKEGYDKDGFNKRGLNKRGIDKYGVYRWRKLEEWEMKEQCYYYGEFECLQCHNKWESFTTWKGKKQGCKACRTFTFPHTQVKRS